MNYFIVMQVLTGFCLFQAGRFFERKAQQDREDLALRAKYAKK